MGSIPTALAGAVTNKHGLFALRFFIGILGGSFVPCQVWSTGFFDKNVVGTSNAFTGGFGNAGGGVTYFLMPAIFDSLVHDRHMTPHKAWRVAFIVPFIVIVTVSMGMLFLCPDTPTGKWSERHSAAQKNLADHGINATIVNVPGELTTERKSSAGTESPSSDEKKIGFDAKNVHYNDHEAHIGEQQMLDTARGEIVQKPSFKEALPVILSLQTLNQAMCYFCSFGAELAINSILGSYYLKNFPKLGQTGTGRWAAMFGLLNVFSRPLGGIVSDFIYNTTGSLWGKKIFIHTLGVITGAFMLAIGLRNPHTHGEMFGLFAAMAMFLEAGNGANFGLVPHVHPHANGIVSGITGGVGNMGGIVFAIIFRYIGTDYAKTIWIIGVMTIGINISLSWIRPIPKNQIGGR